MMKKLISLCLLLSFQVLFCQQTQQNKAQHETKSISDAIAYISKYYSDFTTEYDYKGEYQMLSNYYKPSFSGSNFTITYKTYDGKNNVTVHTEKIDFKKVVSMQPYGGELVKVYGSEIEEIPVALRIGFKTKTEMKTVKIYVENEDDITQAPIYKAFETVWKHYTK